MASPPGSNGFGRVINTPTAPSAPELSDLDAVKAELDAVKAELDAVRSELAKVNTKLDKASKKIVKKRPTLRSRSHSPPKAKEIAGKIRIKR